MWEIVDGLKANERGVDVEVSSVTVHPGARLQPVVSSGLKSVSEEEWNMISPTLPPLGREKKEQLCRIAYMCDMKSGFSFSGPGKQAMRTSEKRAQRERERERERGDRDRDKRQRERAVHRLDWSIYGNEQLRSSMAVWGVKNTTERMRGDLER